MKHLNLKRTYIKKSNYNTCNIENYILSQNYSKDMVEKVEPVLNSIRKSGYIIGINNLKLYYEQFKVENQKGNIVICHGIGEYTEKYNELIYYFINSGYSVFILEHRGNGRSGRLGGDSGQISVEKFNYYIEDLKIFLDEIVIPHSCDEKLLLFSHSMGGGIGTIFLEKYPEYFKGAVLSSPMHKIHTGKAPGFIADLLSIFLILSGKKYKYMPGQKPYTSQRKFPNRTTNCEERYNYQYNKILQNKVFQTGGASALWYFEASKATRYLRRKRNISKVKIPVILIQSECDTHVVDKSHYKFGEYSNNCKIIIAENAKHESFFEVDNITKQVIKEIIDFFDSVIK